MSYFYDNNMLPKSGKELDLILIGIIISIRQMTQTNILFWGNNQHGLLTSLPTKTFARPSQTSIPFQLTDFAASEKHIAFISNDGSLYTYGLNLDGRLGIGAKPDAHYSINNPAKVKLPSLASKVKCGFSHTCVQLANDDLYSWGLGDYGALGTGEFKSKGTPGKVCIKARIVNFSCGAMHSGFVDSEGNVFTCGSNQYGELGVNRPEKVATPILVSFSQRTTQVECGVFYTLLLTTKGQVYGMGNNKYGQLGIGHKVNQCHPTLVRELEGITAISAGYHSGALDAQGSLYIWGSGSFGQLLKPKKFVLEVPIDKIFIRGFFGVGVSTRHQRVYSWGNNTYGQLGRGNYEVAKEPIQIPELSNIRFQSFACGVNFFMAATKEKITLKQLPSAPVTERQRYNYLLQEKRTPYRYGISPQLRPHEAGTFKEEERLRSAERTARTPTRLEQEISGARLRSRSRSRGEQFDTKELISQQIRRSRNRQSGNYQQLFISLSADYQTLLARFKAMEDHLELKNRSLLTQKEQITLLYQDEARLLRQENQMLKRDLNLTKEELRLALARTPLPNETRESALDASRELKTLKDQFRITIKQMEELQAELSSREAELRTLRAISTGKDGQLPYGEAQVFAKELRILKEELKTITRQLQEAQQQIALKNLEIKELKQKRIGADFKDYLQQAKHQVEELTKKNKALKQQLRNAHRKYDTIEEELAIKSLELKELKQKKLSNDAQLKQENQILTQQISYLNKEVKLTKDELKITLRKMDELEEELAAKSLQIKDSKQKRMLYDATEELRAEILAQREDILLLTKDNKALKEELRQNIHRIDQLQRQLDAKLIETKDLKRKINLKDQEIETLKTQNDALSKTVLELKEELKKTLRELEKNQEEIATKTVELRQLKEKKNAEIKSLQKRVFEAENAVSQLQSLRLESRQLRNKEKQLSESLKETTRLLNEKQRVLGQISTNHKRIENQLYKEINSLEQEKIKLTDTCERASFEINKYEEALKASEDAIIALEKHYQLELSDTLGSLAKLKEVQQLNDLRAGELKQIIEEERKRHENLYSEVETGKIKVTEALEEKKELFKIIEDLKQKQASDLKIYQDKVIEAQNKSGANFEKIKQLEVQLSYEKEYHSKCEDSLRQLTDHRDRAYRQLQNAKQEIDKDREKIKELNFQVEKSKTLKKQVEVLTLQLERVQASTRQYRKEIQEILLQKEEILKQLRADLEKKQTQLEKLEEKYEKETGSLNRDIKDLEKKLSAKTKECVDLKKDIERRVGDNETLKDSIEKMNRKLAFKNEEFQKEVREHQRTTEEFNHLRREFTKLKAEKEQIENISEQLAHQKETFEQKINDKKRQIELIQGETRRLQAVIENIRKETQLAKKDLEESKWALQQSKRVNDELVRANKQFAENEEHFTSRISDLEGRVCELQDENKSYTPRYEALLERNRQLDERNRELSEMINKAIEIQAEAYKSNILKEVQINTGEIIQQIKEEQEYKPRSRRREPSIKEIDISETQNLPETKTPGLMSKIKDEPYNRLMQEKISMHKKRVSDSAQKLAGILELGQGEGDGKSFERSMGIRKEEDYEKINSQMQSLNQQKQQFMEKINSFAEKLKIL